MEPLILTLKLADQEATFFNDLRKAHFPIERNFISAHLTIFHSLPAAESAAIERSLTAATIKRTPLGHRITGLRLLGHGVAYTVVSPGLGSLQADLASEFEPWLTPQDRARFAPHITIQNKVEPAAARAL